NQGYCNGAGNPPSALSHPVRYLWEDVWQPDSILELIQSYCADFKQERKGQKPTRTIIFPRYHQRAAVKMLIEHARGQGTGHRYLIQHSAGSGKSNTIAWLADQLA